MGYLLDTRYVLRTHITQHSKAKADATHALPCLWLCLSRHPVRGFGPTYLSPSSTRAIVASILGLQVHRSPSCATAAYVRSITYDVGRPPCMRAFLAQPAACLGFVKPSIDSCWQFRGHFSYSLLQPPRCNINGLGPHLALYVHPLAGKERDHAATTTTTLGSDANACA